MKSQHMVYITETKSNTTLSHTCFHPPACETRKAGVGHKAATTPPTTCPQGSPTKWPARTELPTPAVRPNLDAAIRMETYTVRRMTRFQHAAVLRSVSAFSLGHSYAL